MLAHIEPDVLRFSVYAEADEGVDSFEKNPGDDSRRDGGAEDGDELIEKLSATTSERYHFSSFLKRCGDRWVDLGIGEKAEHEHADYAATAVDAEDIEGIIVAEFRL